MTTTVYLLFRTAECVDCLNDGVVEGVFATLASAMVASGEQGVVWKESKHGAWRSWHKHRGTHYIQEWNAE
jgi:hypothetical protein